MALAAVFLAAGAVKGVTGMGLPTVAMSLLVLWMAPVQAAALLVVPSLLTNLAQCRGGHGRRLLRLLWPAWLALVAGTLLAPELPGAGEQGRRLLGVVLVVYGLWGWWRPVLPDLALQALWAGAVAGGLTGIVTAWTAVFVMPVVPFLQTLKLDKDALVQALGLSFTIATLALALRLQQAGELPALDAEVVLALLAALAGLALGGRVRARLAGPAFQKCVFAVFIALGAVNLLRG